MENHLNVAEEKSISKSEKSSEHQFIWKMEIICMMNMLMNMAVE